VGEAKVITVTGPVLTVQITGEREEIRARRSECAPGQTIRAGSHPRPTRTSWTGPS